MIGPRGTFHVSLPTVQIGRPAGKLLRIRATGNLDVVAHLGSLLIGVGRANQA